MINNTRLLLFSAAHCFFAAPCIGLLHQRVGGLGLYRIRLAETSENDIWPVTADHPENSRRLSTADQSTRPPSIRLHAQTICSAPKTVTGYYLVSTLRWLHTHSNAFVCMAVLCYHTVNAVISKLTYIIHFRCQRWLRLRPTKDGGYPYLRLNGRFARGRRAVCRALNMLSSFFHFSSSRAQVESISIKAAIH